MMQNRALLNTKLVKKNTAYKDKHVSFCKTKLKGSFLFWFMGDSKKNRHKRKVIIFFDHVLDEE